MAAHPLHPAVVHFPLGLLLSATAVDIAGLTGLWAQPHFAALLMAAGLVGGVAAMTAGAIDFGRLDEALVSRALRHMATVSLAWLGYGVALYLRREVLLGAGEPPLLSIVASVISAGLLGLGGWLGGELVYRYGAGRIR